MTTLPIGVLCERARSWAALAPDNELSELERKLLDAHLARCTGCSHFAVRVAEVADALRNERLQPLTYPVSVPSWRRRTAFARMRTVSAAAAVAAMALGVATRAPLPSDGRSEALRLPNSASAGLDERAERDEMRDLRRTILIGVGYSGLDRHFGNQPA